MAQSDVQRPIFLNGYGLAGTGVEIGYGTSLRLLLGGVHLSLGDQYTVGICRAGDFTFDLRVASIQQHRPVWIVDVGIGLPVAERHFSATQAKLSLRFGQGHFSRRDLVL